MAVQATRRRVRMKIVGEPTLLIFHLQRQSGTTSTKSLHRCCGLAWRPVNRLLAFLTKVVRGVCQAVVSDANDDQLCNLRIEGRCRTQL